MRILLHDHAGHAFPAGLGRELARRGHRVNHVHCATFDSAKGGLIARADDPPSLTFGVLSHRRTFAKYRWLMRAAQEVEYGLRASRLIRHWQPDVIISCNTPLLSQAMMSWYARHARVPSVAWVQDLYSAAAADVVTSLAGPAASALTWSLQRIEARTLRASEQVVSISSSLVPQLLKWGVRDERVTVIPNWAHTDEIPVLARPTGWERRHDLEGRFVFAYSGILGLKHNPTVLLELAIRFAGRAELVVVAADGPGKSWLRNQAAARHVRNIHLLGLEPHQVHPEVLGTADVLIALLTDQSGRYSVPSKVLSYLCAGRPIIGVMPIDNDAAEMICRSRAGHVVPPDDHRRVLKVAEQLYDDAGARVRMGTAARTFALTEFDVVRRADEFESILHRAVAERNR
ncbi:glycosyltransferase family 4 protein [Mycobacterium sp. RTGN5]|uniref:glycosyltransferase family 4 protein n=1 Tax=Mycobacterium sp. RTGN5 TaxID=3016522 RepID=UPI0029C9A142|nr:glycosyltransferase family 4 protein [Mycobacterium sp. RTGN5]